MGVGIALKQILRDKKMTIKQLAESSGISVNTLYSITKRDSERVDDIILQRIASVLNVSVDRLLGTEKAPIPEEERQKRLDQLADEINEKKHNLQVAADSTYKFFVSMRALVGSDKQTPPDILFRGNETEQAQAEIEGLIVKFMETATPEEKAAFLLRLDKIGLEFRQQMAGIPQALQDAPESPPVPTEGQSTTPPPGGSEGPPEGE